jgi:hypothetical protein
MDTALPPPKPKIKKEKVAKRMSIDISEDADPVKVSSAPKPVAAAPTIKHDQPISAPTRVLLPGAKASSDRPPKATPAKRPSDAPNPEAPEPKRTAINGSASALPKPAPQPVAASASGLPGARPSGPGPSRPVGTGLGLPRPAPPAGRPPAVPPPPVRSGEDALFIKKKKVSFTVRKEIEAEDAEKQRLCCSSAFASYGWPICQGSVQVAPLSC